MIFFGQASLRHAITQFMTHYHDERNHQRLENRLLRPLWAVGEPDARVKRRQRLGGMLSYIIAKQLDELQLRFWTLRPLPDDISGRLQRNTGVSVIVVVRSTPAFRANVLEGDVLLKINGEDIIGVREFEEQGSRFAGQTVDLNIIRGSDPLTIHLTLNP
jgi:hypothetical protein